MAPYVPKKFFLTENVYQKLDFQNQHQKISNLLRARNFREQVFKNPFIINELQKNIHEKKLVISLGPMNPKPGIYFLNKLTKGWPTALRSSRNRVVENFEYFNPLEIRVVSGCPHVYKTYQKYESIDDFILGGIHKPCGSVFRNF